MVVIGRRRFLPPSANRMAMPLMWVPLVRLPQAAIVFVVSLAIMFRSNPESKMALRKTSFYFPTTMRTVAEKVPNRFWRTPSRASRRTQSSPTPEPLKRPLRGRRPPRSPGWVNDASKVSSRLTAGDCCSYLSE